MIKYAIINNTTIENVILLENTDTIPENAYIASEENIALWVEYENFSRYFPTETSYTPTQFELDTQKYLKRAQVKDKLIAEMAAENMSRVRSGIWTVSNLVSLTQDTELKLVLDDINTLSFELAQAKLMIITNPLLTEEIKNSWILKLQNNLFN